MPVFAACEFPLLDDSEAIERVHAAALAGEPFSHIRIGDGEAVVLSYGDDMSLQDLAYLHTHWGAEGVNLGAVVEVKEDLLTAVRGADLVGIRNDLVDVSLPDDVLDRPGSEVRNQVVSAFHLRQDEVRLLRVGGARRLALLHRILRQTEWSEDQQFCSAWIHWELLATGALNRILKDVSHVGLVTSRPELEHLVARRFDVRTTSVLVPDKAHDSKESGEHVPKRYRTMRSAFAFPEGTLVLVGAGIPGKVYCQWLKEQGCVALDVGSVLDAWVGKPSRALVLESRFGVSGGNRVPSELQLHPPTSSEGRRLIPRWKPSGVPD